MAETRSFDDRDGWIWIDGKMVPWREAEVHVLTHEFAETDPLITKNQTFGEALDLATGCAAFQQQLLPHRPRRRWARSTRHCRAQRYL